MACHFDILGKKIAYADYHVFSFINSFSQMEKWLLFSKLSKSLKQIKENLYKKVVLIDIMREVICNSVVHRNGQPSVGQS